MLIFYGNPDYAIRRSLLFRASRKLWQKARPPAASELPQKTIYFHLHPMSWMVEQLSARGHRVTTKSMRLLHDSDSEDAFTGELGAIWYWLFSCYEQFFPDKPQMAYFVAYVVASPRST